MHAETLNKMEARDSCMINTSRQITNNQVHAVVSTSTKSDQGPFASTERLSLIQPKDLCYKIAYFHSVASHQSNIEAQLLYNLPPTAVMDRLIEQHPGQVLLNH